MPNSRLHFNERLIGCVSMHRLCIAANWCIEKDEIQNATFVIINAQQVQHLGDRLYNNDVGQVHCVPTMQ